MKHGVVIVNDMIFLRILQFFGKLKKGNKQENHNLIIIVILYILYIHPYIADIRTEPICNQNLQNNQMFLLYSLRFGTKLIAMTSAIYLLYTNIINIFRILNCNVRKEKTRGGRAMK